MSNSNAENTIGVLASGGGTNLQAVIDACEAGVLPATVGVVISNNSSSGALRRAREHGAAAVHLSGLSHAGSISLDETIADTLQKHGVRLVVLAGYMKKLGPQTLTRYRNRIVNIHPALLPDYGGKGMYGGRVHAAVLERGDRRSGATVHIVNRDYDQGPILSRRAVAVVPGDTVERLSVRVLRVEHAVLVETIGRLLRGTIRVFDADLGRRTAAVTIRQLEPLDEDLTTISALGPPGAPTGTGAPERHFGPEVRVGLFVEREAAGLASVSVSRPSAAGSLRETGAVQVLFVAPAFRGRGLGSELLAYAERWIQLAGASRAIVCGNAAPDPSEEWLRRRGYTAADAGSAGDRKQCTSTMEKRL